MEEIKQEVGTLALGEPHPSSHAAYKYVSRWLAVNNGFHMVEALATSGIAGNRTAQVCGETLRRFVVGEPLSDRYLLGLAWFLFEMTPTEAEKKEDEKRIIY